MDIKKRLVLFAGFLLILICGTCPPWRTIGFGMNGEIVVPIDMPSGRSLIFSPPVKLGQEIKAGRTVQRIDGGRLLAEISIIAAISGLSFIALCGNLAK